MPLSDISKIIKERRMELGMSYEDVARGVGVNKTTIFRWETGEISTIRRPYIYLLSKVLYIPIEVLLGVGSDDEVESPDVVKARLNVIDSLNRVKVKEDLEQVEKYIEVFIINK